MSFLSRLLGKAPPKKPAENKINQLEALSLEQLVNIIQGGSDEPLRIGAIQRITDQTILLNLVDINAGKTQSAVVQKAAKQRLAQLIESGNIAADLFCESISDKIVLFSILGFLTNSELFEKAFSSIADESLLATFAISGSTSRLRQYAAEKITDKNILQQVLKDSKNKDKTVFKIAKEKFDKFKEEEKQLAESTAALMVAVQSLEQHSQRHFDGQYSAKFSYLVKQWESKQADATPELLDRAQKAITKTQLTISSITDQQAAEEAQRKALATVDAERNSLNEQLCHLLANVIEGTATEVDVSAQLTVWNDVWKKLAAVKSPSVREEKNNEQIQCAIAEELRAQITSGTLSEHTYRFELHVSNKIEDLATYYQQFKNRVLHLTKALAENLPDVVLRAKSACDTWEKAAANEITKVQDHQKQIVGLIRKANESASAGVLGKTLSMRRTIAERLEAIDPVPQYVSLQLELLDEAIAKLQDWKSYAVRPKKIDLIARLESLGESKEHPETLAVKIKRLQDEWKSLTKGDKNQDQDLWEKFHELAQKVYQPCKEYFSEQTLIRQNNLNACKQLVTQLQDYVAHYDWQNANWKDVEKVMRVARQEWRNFTPTERAATQPVLAEFENLLESIYQKLQGELAKNAVLKKELIAQAQQLINVEDARKAADDVKKLQTQWQTIGAAAHKHEQDLWREFRDVCDQVFAKRQQQSAEFKAELDANVTSAKSLVTEIEKLMELSGQSLIDAKRRVEDIRKAFGVLGQLPRAQVNDIKIHFARSLENFEKKIHDERIALKQQIWVNLFSANNLIRLHELALVKGKSVDVAELQSQIDAITHWPTGGLKAIQQKIARVSARVDPEENFVTLRDLCIHAEILTHTPTPAEEYNVRTALQVNQLQQNFGRKIQNVAAEMENLVFEWIAVSAVETEKYESLLARFNICRLKSVK